MAVEVVRNDTCCCEAFSGGLRTCGASLCELTVALMCLTFPQLLRRNAYRRPAAYTAATCFLYVLEIGKSSGDAGPELLRTLLARRELSSLLSALTWSFPQMLMGQQQAAWSLLYMALLPL